MYKPRSNTGLSNWREFPHSQWSFQNVRELIPTALIRGRNTPSKFTDAIAPDAQTISFLTETHTDAFLVYRNGMESERWAAPHYDAENPHIIFSISKSITAMLAGVLVEQGYLETDNTVSHYLPDTRVSAYEDCSVQQLLNMTVALDFTEDYLNPDGDYFRYRNATGWNPVNQTANPLALEPFLYSLKKASFDHGTKFDYKSPNTDLLGLLLERVTDRPLAQLISEHIWQPMGAIMGASSDAYVTVDNAGLARAAGGMCVTPDDLARFGQMILDISLKPSQKTDASTIPKSWIQDTLNNDGRACRLEGDFKSLLPNGRYRNYWYQIGNDDQCFCAIGIHGQWLYINPATQCVIVKLSSQPIPLDDTMDVRCLQAFATISGQST